MEIPDGYNSKFTPTPLNITEQKRTVLNYPFNINSPFDGELRQLSFLHKRSTEKVTDGALWEDENGVLFGSVNYKGIPRIQPFLRYDENAANKISTFGLRDSAGRWRVEEGSKLLRSNGVPTEMVMTEFKLEEIPTNEGVLSVGDWKKKILKERKPLPSVDTHYIFNNRVEKYVQATDFYVHERALQTSERVGDLIATGLSITPIAMYNGQYLLDGNLYSSYEEVIANLPVYTDKHAIHVTGSLSGNDSQYQDIHGMISRIEQLPLTEFYIPGYEFMKTYNRVIKWVNARNSLQAQRDNGIPILFRENNKDDIIKYLTTYLPQQTGANVSRMHNLQLTHGFLTTHNISAVGSFYDLDSLKGKPLGLGDGEVTIEDIERDSMMSLETFFCIIKGMYAAGVSPSHSHYLLDLFDKDAEDIQMDMVSTFVRGYLENRETRVYSKRSLRDKFNKKINTLKEDIWRRYNGV